MNDLQESQLGRLRRQWSGKPRGVVNRATVGLLQADPELRNFLNSDECAAAESVALPVRTVRPGTVHVGEVLAEAGAFGAFVLDGMLVSSLRLNEAPALRLLGPGDVFGPSGGAAPAWVGETHCQATAPTSLALLGDELLIAARRWPRLVAGLDARLIEQTDRVMIQLAICQLPRVEDRLLAMLWLLAEYWGHVTTVGTNVPLRLTHDTLGGLVGARRSTVTLALGELTERGALVRQDRGWLLLEQPPTPVPAGRDIDVPGLLEDIETGWRLDVDRAGAVDEAALVETRAALDDALQRLREQHDLNVLSVSDRLERMREAREKCADLRGRIGLTRQRAPS